jgi:hypothetical protein
MLTDARVGLQQILVVTASGLEVYDVETQTLVEHTPFDPSTLVSPTIAHTTNGAFSYSDATGDIARSVRTYKGKIFLLVSAHSDSLYAMAIFN